MLARYDQSQWDHVAKAGRSSSRLHFLVLESCRCCIGAMKLVHTSLPLMAAFVLLFFLPLNSADPGFPPTFTLQLVMPSLPEGQSNNMTVAWDSLNNRAAICTIIGWIPSSHLLQGTHSSLPLTTFFSTCLLHFLLLRAYFLAE